MDIGYLLIVSFIHFTTIFICDDKIKSLCFLKLFLQYNFLLFEGASELSITFGDVAGARPGNDGKRCIDKVIYFIIFISYLNLHVFDIPLYAVGKRIYRNGKVDHTSI